MSSCGLALDLGLRGGIVLEVAKRCSRSYTISHGEGALPALLQTYAGARLLFCLGSFHLKPLIWSENTMMPCYVVYYWVGETDRDSKEEKPGGTGNLLQDIPPLNQLLVPPVEPGCSKNTADEQKTEQEE